MRVLELVKEDGRRFSVRVKGADQRADMGVDAMGVEAAACEDHGEILKAIGLGESVEDMAELVIEMVQSLLERLVEAESGVLLDELGDLSLVVEPDSVVRRLDHCFVVGEVAQVGRQDLVPGPRNLSGKSVGNRHLPQLAASKTA